MTRQVIRQDGNRPRRSRHGPVLRTALRPVLISAGLLTVYFAAPLDGDFTVVTVLGLIGGLLALAGFIAWQVRATMRAVRPRLRAVEALATFVPMFFVLFATAYYLMGNTAPDAFSESLSRIDALYFTITVFATVGFGDIVPQTEPARVLTMVQMLGDLIVVGLVARILLAAMRHGLDRRMYDTDDA